MWRIGLILAFAISFLGFWTYKDEPGYDRLMKLWGCLAMLFALLIAFSI